MTGWLTVKKGTFAGYPVFEVRHENDDSNLCTLNKAVARQLYDDLGEALGCDRYDEGFQEAQDTVQDWYGPEPHTGRV